MKTSIKTLLIAALCVTQFPSPALADDDPGTELHQLPQEHPYQKVLRDYLASLTVEDYTVPLKPIEFNPEAVESEDELYRLWLVMQYHHKMTSTPDTDGLTLAANNFLLKTIESPEGILMRCGHRGGMKIPGYSIQPADTAWWALWDYPGNPYRGSKAVLNRAFAAAAVDMIMLDHLHEMGTNWVKNARRSDFLGGTLIWLSYVYAAIKDDLPPEVRAAYETGLTKFVGLLTEWGPTGVTDNMDMKANVSLSYIKKAMGPGPVADQADAYIKRNMERIHAAGMIRDTGGLDSSYNGIALVNIIWGARLGQFPELSTKLAEMSILKRSLSLPEPDNFNVFSPSHFNTRTAYGAANDQWSLPYRDTAAAMETDEALYLMFGGRRGRTSALPTREQMVASVKRGMDLIDTFLVPSDKQFSPWVAGWWPGQINFAHDFYEPGFYDKIRKIADSGQTPSLLDLANGPGVRAFPPLDKEGVSEGDTKAFMVGGFETFRAIVYTGPIGRTGYMNFAGGALSAFWTPAGGSIILGRTGLPVDPVRSKQDWKNWQIWPTNALSGETADGEAFSSARLRRVVSEVEYQIEGTQGKVSYSGPLGADHDKSRTAENGCIKGDVTFRREFLLNPEGVVIQSSLESNGKDRVSKLFEILPISLGDDKTQKDVPLSITLVVGEEEFKATSDPREGVTAVVIKRFGGGARIEFETPQRVQLSPEDWVSDYQTAARVRNLMIDLLPKGTKPQPLPTVELRYRVRPL